MKWNDIKSMIKRELKDANLINEVTQVKRASVKNKPAP